PGAHGEHARVPDELITKNEQKQEKGKTMSRINIATRREFLGRGLGLVGIGAALPNYLVHTSLAGTKATANDRIVVGLLLTGGHDGLSDMPPHGNPEYYKLRKLTRIDEKKVIKIDDQMGLHPNLAGFKELLDEGQFAAVMGTAYPNFNLSHFASRDFWEAGHGKGRTGKRGATGWLGRYLDEAFADNKDPKLSLAVGPGRHPLTITGKDHPGIAFSSPATFGYVGDRSKKGYPLYQDLNQMASKKGGGDMQFVTQTAVNANDSSDTLRKLVLGYETPVEYPDTQFGNSLRTIAGLIAKGMDTRVYYAAQGIAKFGGYDTHADQPRRHDELMTELCASVMAFQKDLASQGNAERVLTFTFSEFGRRAKENQSGGTDHGLAQPMYLFGPGVKPGLHGKHPDLVELDNDNLKMEVDFRGVYAAILQNWLGTPSDKILGEQFPLIDCVG
ncbi:MAG: DUF1501 domain-containing protein, partial [Verrucomicrobiales bacterium]